MNLELWRKTKKERGMTYQDIAELSGMPLGTIKNIFAGYTPDPRESTIKAIERALGVETNIVYIEKSPIAELSPDDKELLGFFSPLPPEYRAQILEYARFVAERANATKRRNY